MSPRDVPPIPAMTTEAERDCFYRLVRDGAQRGAVVELGAWLGASTAHVAAALRDAGGGKVDVYDNFEHSDDHVRKVAAFYAKHGMKGVPFESTLDAFRGNLGSLIEHVAIHKGNIEDAHWRGEPIAVLICDAPKDVERISSVLTTFGPSLGAGSVMAWQDFCHFPSYPIPACLYRLREHLEVLKAVDTTMVFRVSSQWDPAGVSRTALALEDWSANEIEAAWSYWRPFVPSDKRALFDCGAALFLFDAGETWRAATWLSQAWDGDADAIARKWHQLDDVRADFAKRYWPLLAFVERQGRSKRAGS